MMSQSTKIDESLMVVILELILEFMWALPQKALGHSRNLGKTFSKVIQKIWKIRLKKSKPVNSL